MWLAHPDASNSLSRPRETVYHPAFRHMEERAPGSSRFVGRGQELALLSLRLTEASEGHPQVVGVEGVAGIGKTSLVRRFLTGQGGTLLWGSGDEGEAGLPWGVLGQLARAAAAQGLPQLSKLVARLDPQADPVMVGAGLLALMSEIGVRPPLVVVVDDAHWSDPQSLAAARFAFRRLVSERFLGVVTYRPGEAARLGEGWRRLLDGDERATRLRLQGLASADLSELARATCGRPLSRRAADRLLGQTGGHPLYVRSLLEQLPLATIERSEGPWPAPADLASALSARLASCSQGAQDLVAMAAVLGRPCRVTELARLSAEPAGSSSPGFASALEEALSAGLLVEVPGTAGAEVEFSHVLVRSAVYHDLSPGRRRQLHARAGAIVSGEAGLRHRVAAAVGPDATLAGELERLARARFDAGRVSEGASILKKCLELTPAGPERRPRLLESAEGLLVAGDVPAAGELGEELAALGQDPWSDYVNGYLALLQAKVDEAERLFGRAQEALGAGEFPEGAPADLAARVASQLAIIAIVRLDYPAMVRFGEAAVAAGVSGPRVAQFAWFARLIGLSLSGRSDEALRLLGRLDQPGGPGGLDALVARGMVRLWTDDLAGAREDLSRALERAELGEPLRISQGLGFLAEVAFRQGRLEEATVQAELAVEDATEGGRVWDLAILHAQASFARAARGELEEAAAHAEQSTQWAALMGTNSARAYAAVARGALARARGDTAAFHAAAADLAEAYEALEPGAHILGPALAQSLADLGRTDEAAKELSSWEEKLASTGRRSGVMLAARVRGMLRAVQGQWPAAEAEFQKAVLIGEDLGMPLEVGISLLEWGRAAKASGERRAAVRQLTGAASRFSALGAGAYAKMAAQALQELGAAGPGPRDLPANGLTLTEGAVARLVAARLSNAEVAARLMMSGKTVEYHLTHIYAKLGVRSRRELAARLTEA
jgi:DNA-binding CsgD family transcriptional regulator/predicted negative regulator of RcsB-dependent stress response